MQAGETQVSVSLMEARGPAGGNRQRLVEVDPGTGRVLAEEKEFGAHEEAPEIMIDLSRLDQAADGLIEVLTGRPRLATSPARTWAR